MIIIGGSSHQLLAKQLSDTLECEYVIANTKKFANQELSVQINRSLLGQDVIILQSTTTPVNDHLMELLFLADTAKRAGCKKITAIIPYFGYSRQDRLAYKYGPISVSLIAKLIEASGIDKVITIDLHSKQCEDFFKIAITNIDSTDLFVKHLISNKNYIVISPDIGGLERAKILATKLKTDLAIINKTRHPDGRCTTSKFIGNIAGKDCLIIDDIIDTGSTLCNAANMLMRSGANSVSACITHAVFSECCIDTIEKMGFADFFITDTIYHQALPHFIKTIQINELIAKALS